MSAVIHKSSGSALSLLMRDQPRQLMSNDLHGRVALSPAEFIDSVFCTRGLPGDWLIRWGNKRNRLTKRCGRDDLLKKLSSTEENYISLSYLQGGQSDCHVKLIEAVCIDLDAKHQAGGVATPEQIEMVCRLVPFGIVVVANGVQVIFRPAHSDWAPNVADLVALGEYLEKQTGLSYDRGCHVRKDGSAAAHRNHAFRGSGFALKANRPVLLLAPSASHMGTTTDALQHLGLSPAEIKPPREKGKKQTTTTRESNLYSVSRIEGDTRGSKAAQNTEYVEEILTRWTDGIYKHGRSRIEVEAAICAIEWEHHKASSLAKSLASLKVYQLADGGILPDDQWEAIQKDLEDLMNWVGPRSFRRKSLQRTTTLRANRAWSFEFLYFFKHSPLYNLTLDEALTAFWNWPEFQTIREMSIAALKSVGTVEDDLRQCWEKWSDGSTQVSDEHIEAVEKAIHEISAGNFKRTDIQALLPDKSERLIKRALKELADAGKVKLSKAGRSSSYTRPGFFGKPTKATKPVPEPKEPAAPALPPPPAKFEEHLKMAIGGWGDGHHRHGGIRHKIENTARFNELYREVWNAVSCKGEVFDGPSLGRLYGFLATKAPSGHDAGTVTFSTVGGNPLANLVPSRALTSEEFLKVADQLHPDLTGTMDMEIIESAGHVSIRDFGTLAVKSAAQSIEQVLTRPEMIRLMESMETEPWLRAGRSSLVLLRELGYTKLKKWFSDQLGEEVEALYLGPKPAHSGVPFGVSAAGKSMAI